MTKGNSAKKRNINVHVYIIKLVDEIKVATVVPTTKLYFNHLIKKSDNVVLIFDLNSNARQKKSEGHCNS